MRLSLGLLIGNREIKLTHFSGPLEHRELACGEAPVSTDCGISNCAKLAPAQLQPPSPSQSDPELQGASPPSMAPSPLAGSGLSLSGKLQSLAAASADSFPIQTQGTLTCFAEQKDWNPAVATLPLPSRSRSQGGSSLPKISLSLPQLLTQEAWNGGGECATRFEAVLGTPTWLP